MTAARDYSLVDEPQPAEISGRVRIVGVPRLPALYYLQYFRGALNSLNERYAKLLNEAELAFIQRFADQPEPVQCLLTRMLMRKGASFRRATLGYPEVGDLEAAVGSLTELGWLDIDPVFTLEALFDVLSREEWRRTFGSSARRRTDKEGMQLVLPSLNEPASSKPLTQWNSQLAKTVVHLTIEPVAKRLEWLYFGNDYQTWAEFVLSDLGLKRYEQVPSVAGSCAFKCREEIEHFYRLQDCRARLRAGEPAASIFEHSYCPEGVADWLKAQFGMLQNIALVGFRKHFRSEYLFRLLCIDWQRFAGLSSLISRNRWDGEQERHRHQRPAQGILASISGHWTSSRRVVIPDRIVLPRNSPCHGRGHSAHDLLNES